MEKELLSEHLSVKEYEFSPTATRHGVSNKMIPEHKKNAIALAVNIFEPIREHRKAPIRPSSGYRSLELNKRIGGSESSQHMRGEAIDLPLTNDEAKWIIDNLTFDQLIFEFPDDDGDAQWIHVSYTTHKTNRKQVLISIKDEDGNTDYLAFNANIHLLSFTK